MLTAGFLGTHSDELTQRRKAEFVAQSGYSGRTHARNKLTIRAWGMKSYEDAETELKKLVDYLGRSSDVFDCS